MVCAAFFRVEASLGVNPHLLIDAIVQQTVVFIAQLATAGGVRVPLAQIADQIFLELSTALTQQGVSKKVIADMFGMALRTYHRKVQAARQSRTESGQSVWAAVFEHIRASEPVSGNAIHRRFVDDDPEVVAGVLNDLVNSGLVYRAGRGDTAVYRAAGEADFSAAESGGADAGDWLVWLTVYRHGPVTRSQLEQLTRLPPDACARSIERLLTEERVVASGEGAAQTFTSERLEVPLGETRGWEAAVLDHFQAMVAAVSMKLTGGASSGGARDAVGGSTWSLDVSADHPLYEEARGTLARIRTEVEDLRTRIDAHNAAAQRETTERVVVYVGQYVAKR